MGIRSNQGCLIQIGRPGEFGCAGGGGTRRRRAPAAGGSPDLANLGRPGVKSSGLWPGMEFAACVIHLGARSSEARLGTACAAAEAGVRGGALPASAVLASERVHGPLTLAHNNREGSGVLTEGSKPAGRDAAAPETMGSGGGRCCARDQVVAGLLRTTGPRGSMRGRAARLDSGSARARDHRRQGNSRAERLT